MKYNNLLILMLSLFLSGCGSKHCELDLPDNNIIFSSAASEITYSYPDKTLYLDTIISDENDAVTFLRDGEEVIGQKKGWISIFYGEQKGLTRNDYVITVEENSSPSDRSCTIRLDNDGPIIYEGYIYVTQKGKNQ